MGFMKCASLSDESQMMKPNAEALRRSKYVKKVFFFFLVLAPHYDLWRHQSKL